MPLTNKTQGPFNAQFKTFAAELDAANEKRERLVKASRDVTYASKKVIFELHRSNPTNRDAVLANANKAMLAIRKTIASRIVVELDPDSAARFRRSFSPGLQEYIEARTFLDFIASNTLLTPTQIEHEIILACAAHKQHTNLFKLENSDYVLGIADLTGELMRRAVAAAGHSDRGAIEDIWRFMKVVEVGLKALDKNKGAIGRDFPQKMKVLENNIGKVERSSCDLAVRAAEFKRMDNFVDAHVDEEPAAKRRRVE